MSDERNDGWHHRSQFKDVRDPGLKTVTANVKTRRHGKLEGFYPAGNNPRQESDEAPHSGDWEDAFDDRHLPNGKYDDASDERSNREKLLNGETV